MAISVFGQKKKVQINPNYGNRPFHLGFALGTNFLNYRLLPSEEVLSESLNKNVFKVEPVGTVGLNLSIISNLRMGKFFSLRFQPGLIFGQRNLRYQVRDDYYEDTLIVTEHTMHISSIYIDVPISVKFNARRINNYQPYFIVGTAMKYDLETKRVIRQNGGYAIRQDPIDFFYEFGFGVDWFLPYFKFGAELKFSFGTKNILRQEDVEYSSVIKSLKTRMIVLAFNFE